MAFTGFHAGELNKHYDGEYSEDMMRWRQIGASDKTANIASLIGSHANDILSVLEVGCGTGAVLANLKSLGVGRTHVGIDMSDPNAHREADADGIDLLQYDGKIIPFPADHFDFVYATHVLEHVEDERSFLIELSRVAKKLVYIEVPCELNIRANVSRLQDTLNIGHINSYTPESFSLTLYTSGLRVSEIRAFDHSAELHRYRRSAVKAAVIMGLRRAMLAASPKWASRIFTYHVGALCIAPEAGA